MMKMFNIIYRNHEQLAKTIRKNNIRIEKNVLVQIFSGILDKEILSTLLQDICVLLPDAIITGATTAGEIINDKACSASIIISISVFESTCIQAQIVTNMGIADSSALKSAKLILLFSAGVENIPTRLLEQINSAAKDAIMAGSVAGDNNNLVDTWIFYGTTILHMGVVLISLTGKSLFVRQAMKFDWKPMGNEMIITEGKDGLVRTINGYGIEELYKKFFGEHIASNLLAIASLFPLMRKQENKYTASIILQDYTDGSCYFSNNFSTGDHVVFGCANIENIIDSQYLENICDYNIEGIFIFSCVVRKRLMGSDINKGIGPLAKIAPTVGFFSYGEYFTNPDKTKELVNNTMTLVTLSEHPYKRHYEISNPNTDENQGLHITSGKVFQALVNFTNTLTKELIESNQNIIEYAAVLNIKNSRLEKLYITDKLTGLYNRYKLEETLNHLITSYNSCMCKNHLFSVISFDIDNFKNVNDRFGHTIGDDVLKKISDIAAGNLRSDDTLGRWGGEEFLIICPKASLDEAIAIAERIRRAIESYDFPTVKKVTGSFGVAEITPLETSRSLIQRVDAALYKAKSDGRNHVIAVRKMSQE
jgi:c-di-GMP phosphodiesterase